MTPRLLESMAVREARNKGAHLLIKSLFGISRGYPRAEARSWAWSSTRTACAGSAETPPSNKIARSREKTGERGDSGFVSELSLSEGNQLIEAGFQRGRVYTAETGVTVAWGA